MNVKSIITGYVLIAGLGSIAPLNSSAEVPDKQGMRVLRESAPMSEKIIVEKDGKKIKELFIQDKGTDYLVERKLEGSEPVRTTVPKQNDSAIRDEIKSFIP